MSNPTVITHYADGRPSETREMTDEEVKECFPQGIEQDEK